MVVSVNTVRQSVYEAVEYARKMEAGTTAKIRFAVYVAVRGLPFNSEDVVQPPLEDSTTEE